MNGVKSRAAAFAARAGAARVVRAARRLRGAPGRALILFYHRINDAPSLQQLAVAPRLFERQVEILARRARVVPLSCLVERLAEPEPLVGDLAAITFDDGYRDNLEVAAPILERLGVPATVFVATDYIDRRAVPFWERIEHALTGAWRRGATPADVAATGDPGLDVLVREALAVPGAAGPVQALATAVRDREPGRRERLLGALEKLGGALAPEAGLMMDWDDLRALARRGFEIGSHTASHAWMPGLGAEALEHELAGSKRRIESELGVEAAGFAYPWGEHVPAQLPRLAACGYRWAVTVEPGVNRPGAERFQLRRIAAGLGAPAVFDLKLALGRT